MAAKIVVPELGESVLEATVGHWLKKEGDRVGVGDVLVSLETDKVDLEVGAERAGVLARIERKEGEDVKIGDLLGVIEEADRSASVPPASEIRETGAGRSESGLRTPESKLPTSDSPAPTAQPLAPEVMATPSARRLALEHAVDLSRVPPSDQSGRVTKEDVERFLETAPPVSEPSALPTPPGKAPGAAAKPAPEASAVREMPQQRTSPAPGAARREERIRMSRRRQTIARRLVEAQRTAAMLTTFNEVDMTAVMELRKRQNESFKQKHGVGLGIASFFVKASVAALKDFPRLNAEIQGDEMVLKDYYDIGVAVGASEGLVVPVLRDADRMSFAAIEIAIKGFAKKASDSTLSLEDLRGGTFTITNGGVFGSLMSTPILNPPQVGILGLHKIQERPVSLNHEIVSRLMMYVALSYDHRIVDGMEAVQFLVRVKELVEDPAVLLLQG